MPPERDLDTCERVLAQAAPAPAPAPGLPAASLAALASGELATPVLARAIAGGQALSNHGLARLLSRKKLQSTLASADIYDDFDEENSHETEFREEIKKLIATIDAKGITETDPVRYTEAEAAAWNAANPDAKQKMQTGHYKSGGGIEGWFTGGDLDVGRGRKAVSSETEARMAGYTTCGDFMSRVWAKAEIAAKKRNKDIKIDFGRTLLADGKTEQRITPFLMHRSLLNKAWHPGSEAASRKPKPGDCYFLEFVDTGEQSHVGFIKSISDRGDGKQTWVTVDGGQRSGPGTPDRILERTRLVEPTAGLVHGGENADSKPRRLRGWLDVDQVVFYTQ